MRAAVFMLFNDEGKILLQKRDSTYKPHPNAWTFFGGHIRENETSLECVMREVKEELGVELELELCKKIRNEYGLKELYLYRGELNNLKDVRLTEGSGMAFFGLDEIDNLKSPNKELIKKWLKT